MTVESRLSQTTGPDEISGMRQKERRKDFGKPWEAKKNDKSKLKRWTDGGTPRVRKFTCQPRKTKRGKTAPSVSY